MKNGVSLMEDPDGARYEEAYPEFKRAYELSGSLNALQNMAICAMKLERDGEAIDHYEKFLAGKGDSLEAGAREQVERDLSTLKSTVSWVTLQSDKTNVTLTDVRTPAKGSTVTNTYTIGIKGTKLGIHPGQHSFTATLSGKKDQSWNVKLENGSKQNHSFLFDTDTPVTAEGLKPDDLKPHGDDKTVEMHRPVPAYAWAVGAISWATIPVWIGLAVNAKLVRNDYENNVKGIAPIEEQNQKRDDVKKANVIADAMLGLAGGTVLISTILFLVRPEVPVEPAEQAGDAPRFGVDYVIAPSVEAAGGGAFVTARF
ncbi:MAG: tetratricopeptide repeat protein [Polyangiaceae bacterium]|nr:tetratricopeptide repeat protein [Polyangiaceae bacterium]